LKVEWAQETKRMIDKEGGVCEVVQVDVTDEESCKKAVARTVELWGGVHILVNNGTLPLLSQAGGRVCRADRAVRTLIRPFQLQKLNLLLAESSLTKLPSSWSRQGVWRRDDDRHGGVGPWFPHQCNEHGPDEPVRHPGNEKGRTGVHRQPVVCQRP